MELELMFSEQKWNILKSLSYEKSSPIQLAGKLNTTMANISQQLRLLEATNLVKKEKVKNRDRGKPRTLFSLNNDCAYLAIAMQGFAGKKLLMTGEHHQITMRIWLSSEAQIHEHIERAYWKIRHLMPYVSLIALNKDSGSLAIACDKKNEVERILGKGAGIETEVMPLQEAEKLLKSGKGIFSLSSNIFVIYDRNGLVKAGSGGA